MLYQKSELDFFYSQQSRRGVWSEDDWGLKQSSNQRSGIGMHAYCAWSNHLGLLLRYQAHFTHLHYCVCRTVTLCIPKSKRDFKCKAWEVRYLRKRYQQKHSFFAPLLQLQFVVKFNKNCHKPIFRYIDWLKC